MSKLEIYKINSDMFFSVVRDNIVSCRGKLVLPSSSKFHNSLPIEDVPIVLKEGLLSKRLRRAKEGFSLTKEEEASYNDPCCVNGADAVSVSTMDPEVPFSMMYDDEDYYDSYYAPYTADIVMSKDLHAYGVSTNYFNELLVNDQISPLYFTGINVRVLRALDKISSDNSISGFEKASKTLKLYESLRKVASCLKSFNEDRRNSNREEISLIEDSGRKFLSEEDIRSGKTYSNEGIIGLDLEKVQEMPKILVK